MRGGFTNVRAGIAPFRKALAELRKQAIAAVKSDVRANNITSLRGTIIA